MYVVVVIFLILSFSTDIGV